ncbi:MAG: hypothetical protein HGA71_07705 [Azonexaceae bacterium]|nr:hypothetical protein [Azonexaceae bacterium]
MSFELSPRSGERPWTTPCAPHTQIALGQRRDRPPAGLLRISWDFARGHINRPSTIVIHE